MSDIDGKESYYVEFRDGGGRGRSVRILKPDAYAAHYECAEGEPKTVRQAALDGLSRRMPDGLRGYVVDIRERRQGKGRTAVEVYCMKEEAYSLASDDGKARVHVIESLIPRRNDGKYLIEYKDMLIGLDVTGGAVSKKVVMKSRNAGSMDEIALELEAEFPQEMEKIPFPANDEEAILPAFLRNAGRASAFRVVDAGMAKKRERIILAAAILLPAIAFAGMAAFRAAAYRQRYSMLTREYNACMEKAIAFSQSEKAVKELNADRLRNDGLKRILATCLEGFAANGCRMVSFSFDGATFRVTGSGGSALDILKRMSRDGSIGALRLIETGGGSSKNEFTITGKASK